MSKSEVSKSSEKSAHSTPTTRLVLVRHAVTPQTGPLLSGRKPGIDLSDEGRAQAKAVGIRLAPPVRIDRIFASPIERTQQTAQAIAEHHNLEVVTLDGVIEAEYGDWTGGAIAELARTDLWRVVQTAPSRARFPNGEGIAEMQARMVAALDELITNHAGEHIVVVSHADPIKSAIA
ncbi:MAG: histidine phosphatase family protein, partial [Acidimicrobiia bacterium]|nr:histidine phosphatase family protein [Acidimicrobiia bacterium]